MSGRLFRFTPHGGKPNHYTDSLASAMAQLPNSWDREPLLNLEVDQVLDILTVKYAPGMELWAPHGTWERVA